MCLETSLKPQTEINICIVVIPFVVKYYIAFGVFFFFKKKHVLKYNGNAPSG